MEHLGELLKKSQKYLQSAAVLLELEDFDSCASRAYFAMFFAARALLLREGISPAGNHSIRSSFLQAFVGTGELPTRAGIALEEAAALQEMGDYASEFAVGRAEAERTLQEAEAFVNSIARRVAWAAQPPA